MIDFDVNTKERELIGKIAERGFAMARKASAMRNPGFSKMDLEMDITAAHCNGQPLRLEELLEADDFNFSHDVFGIRRHLDRSTGTLGGYFLPRFIAKKEAPDA